MASNVSTRSESPADIDFSVIRTSIQMNHRMIDQILHGIHYGSEEVRSLLRDECDFILECKVCRNLFRSFPNFVAHKRVYCIPTYEETVENSNSSFTSMNSNIETVVVHPEAPENRPAKVANKPSKSTAEAIIDTAFEGKSKEYQFYTKVAEDVERQKMTKVTKTIALKSIPTNKNAVIVTESLGDNSEEILKEFQEQQELEKAAKAAKKKNALTDVCDSLIRKGQASQEGNQKSSVSMPKKIIGRSRKSSPRKSMEYVTDVQTEKVTRKKTRGSKIANVTEEIDADSEWSDVTDNSNTVTPVANDKAGDKDWMKLCDIKKLTCTTCMKRFSSLHGLKFHCKMKHLSPYFQYKCPDCSKPFEHFNGLAHHLKTVHKMSDSTINNVKLKLSNSQSPKSSPVKMEIDQEPEETANKESEKGKPTDRLLSYSTGWKKCDKCNKVFWKGKSYTRHLPCKGLKEKTKQASQQQVQKSPTKTATQGIIYTPSSVETIIVGLDGKVIKRNRNKELIHLQEKLRAKALTPTQGTGNTAAGTTDKERDVTAKSASPKKEVNTSSKLYKVLTGPLKTVGSGTSTKLVEDQAKYNLRQQKVDKEATEKLQDTQQAKTRASSSEISGLEGSSKSTDEFKKLEERLTREAGLTDAERGAEVSKSTRGVTRSAAKSKETAVSVTEIETVVGIGDADKNVAELYESPKKNGKPEIQELQQKLARKVLGQADDVKDNDKEDESVDIGKTDDDMAVNPNTVDNFIEPKVETRASSMDRSRVETVQSTKHMTRSREQKEESDAVSESDRRRRHASESSNDMAAKRHFRSISQGCEPVGRLGEKTPEKESSLMQASPLIARRSSFPTSPTHSLNSNSGDSYNCKFKMTVKEMAELVESASLTKFAKERKKKAKNFLTKKQAMDSQKLAPMFTKSIRKRRIKKAVVVRNMYETRRSGASEDVVILTESKSKRLLLEQRRLQDSAGFVAEKFYDTGHSPMLKDAQRNIDKRKSCLTNETETTKITAGSSVALVSGVKKTTHDAEKLPNATKSHTAVTPSRDSSSEQKRSREMKNLANSAGFVEDSYLTSSSSDSLRDKSTESSHGRTLTKTVKHSDVSIDKKVILEKGVNAGNESDDSSSRLSRNRTRRVPMTGDGQLRLRNVSDSSTESKERKRLKIPGGNVSKVAEIVENMHKAQESDSADSSVSRSERLAKKTADKVADKVQSEDVKAINTKTSDDANKHRTRLSTGSIYFDSDLLRLSPTKIEKKLAAVAKRSKEISEEKLLKTATCKKLNLSPRKPNTSKCKPGFYPMSTGIKQCPKCQKRFWKKKSYDYHMQHSCKGTSLMGKTGRKRMLSISPREKTAKGKESDGKTSEVLRKKAKLDSRVDDYEHEKVATKDKLEVDGKGNEVIRGNNNKLKNISPSRGDKARVEESVEVGNVSPIFERIVKNTTKGSPVKVTERIETRLDKKQQLTDTGKSPKESPAGKNEQGVVTEKEPDEITEDDEKDMDGVVEIEVTGREKKVPTSVDELSESLAQPGPSGLNTSQSVVDEESEDDDNCSEFSGFSEDDLKMTEEELSAHLNVSGRETAEHVGL